MTRHPHRFLLYCLIVIVPAVGMLAATAATAATASAQTTSAVTARPSPAAEAQALAKAAIEKLAVGQHPLNHQVGATSPAGKPKGLTNVQSTN
jgi:cytochrome b561